MENYAHKIMCAHFGVKCANWSEMYAYHKIKSFYAYETYAQLHVMHA